MRHPLGWVAWLAACSASVWRTRNPLYLILAVLAIVLVRNSSKTESDNPSVSSWRWIFAMVPISALFNALWTRVGDTRLFVLPDWLPLVGGAITLEALTYGAQNGLVLLALLLAFSVVNQHLSIHDWISFVPRVFHQLAVVVTIAVTYVPLSIREIHVIRDAQTIRGHQPRGARDWVPLFVPLLTGALERALTLSESMAARGFAAPVKPSWSLQGSVIAGAALICLGGLTPMLSNQIHGLIFILPGIALVVIALLFSERRSGVVRYEVQHLWRMDMLALFLSVVVVLLPMAPWLDSRSLVYYPYPVLTAPAFDPWFGGGMMLIAFPAFLAKRSHI